MVCLLRFGIVGILSSLLSSCYSLEQAYWFNNAFNSRMSLEEALQQPGLDAAGRRKLQLSRQILAFAKSQGLNTGQAYQHYIPPGPGTVSYLVQAAEVDRLELKTWWFPLIGRVPYLGFFDKGERDRKANELKEQGLEVSLGTVGAFSSLGWFADPIYDAMTRRKDEDFAALLLHELVHRSFWSKGSAAFNENLAEFGSLMLTETFLKEQRGGMGLTELRSYRADRERLSQWILGLKAALKEAYARSDWSREQKLEAKAKIINEHRTEKFPKLLQEDLMSAQKREWNNASIMGAALYAPDTERFQKAYDCLHISKIGEFLYALRQAESAYESVEEALDSLCPMNAERLGGTHGT